MSRMHSPRTPWVMVAVFCAAALLLLAAAAGRDLGMMFDAAPEPAPVQLKREVRMPIVIEKSVASPPAAAQSKPPIDETSPSPHGENSPGRPSAKHSEATQPVPRAAGNLLSHDLQWRDGRFEAHFQTDRPAAGSKIFFKPSPAMWVVDLPGRWQNRARRINPIDRGEVARVVIGEHPDFLRVVFHYRNKETHRPAEAPRITELENGFAVVIQ